jgi:multiple sugar transport system ATP-binding protein
MAKVFLENIYKIYTDAAGDVIAVDDVNLEIASGELMVLVGPSGCGKSTTLRMIAGLEDISRGGIHIDGRRVNDIAPKDRDISMVFQNYALYPHMTVYKNMAFGLQLRKFPAAEIETRVNDAAQILGLTPEMLARRPHALSGGQRQRVALGRAIVRKPKVFLFDEPLSNLDAKMRVQLRTEIARLHQRIGTTMIYVTHDQVEAMTMGDRICLLKSGRIQQVARPLEIYHEPANMFVAAFIGSPPMNFFTGTVLEKNGRLCFRELAKPGCTPFTLELDEQHVKRLAQHRDQPIFLGMRPENFYPARGAQDHPACRLTAAVDVVEAMGAETFSYVCTGSHEFILRSAAPLAAKTGIQIELTADMSKAHFFEWTDPAPYRRATGEIDTENWQAACKRIV